MARRRKDQARPSGLRVPFDEAKHRREASGRFGDMPGKGDDAPRHPRAFGGRQIETAAKLSKLETGALGERIAIAHLKSKGLSDAGFLNTKKTNYPVDIQAGNHLVEVKAGLVSNSPAAQQWRAMIGQPSKRDAEWLKTASKEDKAAFNRRKSEEILQRKHNALVEHSRMEGRTFTGKTVTVIINPDTKTADIFEFEGFHLRIPWNSEEAHRGFVRTVRYDDEI